MSTFIFGLDPYLPFSALAGTKELYAAVGDNTGNLAFQFAVRHHLPKNVPVIPWSASIDVIDSTGDLMVMPCANQLGTHLDLGWLGEKLAKTNSRPVLIGLGGQFGLRQSSHEISSGTIQWLQIVKSRAPTGAPNIGLRGERSFRALEEHGFADSALVIGCPSLFINLDRSLGRKIAKRAELGFSRIAVASGHQGWKHLSKLEASLAQLVSDTHGSYIGQSPLEMVAATRGDFNAITEPDLDTCRQYCLPNASPEQFKNWLKTFGATFFDVGAWMEHYRHFDLVIGTRIHGVALAIQAGLPGICIAHDSRTLELCQTMKIPHVVASEVVGGIERGSLKSLFNFDADEFDRNRANLARRYVDFLIANNVPVHSRLVEFARGLTQVD